MTKLVHYIAWGRERFGASTDNGVIDLNAAYADLLASQGESAASTLADARVSADPLSFIQGGQATLAAAAEAIAYASSFDAAEAKHRGLLADEADVEVLSPIKNPPKIICVARNYGKHAAEAGLQVSEIPILFARFASTIVDPGKNVVVPKVSDDVDWEGELAVVIGKGGRHISKEDALDHVLGYSIFNDVSVRDYQFRVTQYTEGKNFHASGPFGPYIVLKDEVPDPHSLKIVTTLNGEVMQDANTDEMIFDVPYIINHISTFIELEPGDVIPMGTPAGVGFKRQPPIFLRGGDTITVEVEKLGKLENPVVDESDA